MLFVSQLINKFYVIRQASLGCFVDRNVEEKCTHLLDDPPEMWSFDCHSETSTSKYIVSLEPTFHALCCCALLYYLCNWKISYENGRGTRV